MQLRGRIPGKHGIWDVCIDQGLISSVTPVSLDVNCYSDKESSALWISPGFFDIQVNGQVGVSFSAADLTTEHIEKAIQALWSTGISLVLPTITTAPFDRLEAAAKALRKAMEEASPEVSATIAGLHFEGPYISGEDGPRGAHKLEYVKPPCWDEFQRLQEAAGGNIRIITIAPEHPGSEEFISKVSASGVVVALGHTNASAEQIARAVAAGAKLSTHLGNGAHAVIPRHPNYIWEQLANDELYASLIPDGFHLPPAVLKAMMRGKEQHRCILTTDAAAITGLSPGSYGTTERQVELVLGGPVRLKGTPYLAGSALRLCDGIANACRFAGISLEAAISMVTENPARLLEMETKTGPLRAGQEANLTVFRVNNTGDLLIEKTITRGKVVFTLKA